MSDLKRNKDGAIILCCGGKGCPTMRLVDDRVIIEDDDGNVIDISQDEAKLIGHGLSAGGARSITQEDLAMKGYVDWPDPDREIPTG